jgi:hypothetical protein
MTPFKGESATPANALFDNMASIPGGTFLMGSD